MRPVLLAILALALAACGCQPQTIAQPLQSDNPQVRIDAAVEAGRTRDQAAVPYLVDRLNDSEPDVRFFSFIALKKITGQTFGWNYASPPADRDAAVQRWRQWLKEGRPAAATQEVTTDGSVDGTP